MRVNSVKWQMRAWFAHATPRDRRILTTDYADYTERVFSHMQPFSSTCQALQRQSSRSRIARIGRP